MILVAGKPCSGKTYVAKQIAEYFSKENSFDGIHLVNLESLGLSPMKALSGESEYKTLRGLLKTKARSAPPGHLVVIDSMLGNKSIRYELFCTAREREVTYAVVYVTAQEEVRNELFSKGEQGYGEAEFNRFSSSPTFSPPIDTSFWDRPLLTFENLGPDANQELTEKAMNVLLEDLKSVLVEGKPLRAKSSTKVKVSGSAEVAGLDIASNLVIEELMGIQRTAILGDVLELNCGASFKLLRRLTMATMQRVKREFLRASGTSNFTLNEAQRLFIEFLTKELD